MEVYSDFQIKDHYYWSDAAPDFITREEREAAKVKREPKPQPKTPPIRQPHTRKTAPINQRNLVELH